ncbi:hypothetical protein Fmac_008286 [Flemingia macrophylla]|uniref:Uncharacterized protein n=1 Tax=Flemingia macrophylla TaxID=520843 RepID=A0ABD1MWY5_9FABA
MDPIKYLFEKPMLTGRIARWQVLLSEFDIVHVTQKAIKGSALADYLAHGPTDEYQSLQDDFLDEHIMTLQHERPSDDTWTMFFDGASNMLGHGIGAVLISLEMKYIPITARLNFDCTNNMSQYEACTLGIQAALDNRITKLKVFGDSSLVIYQLKGEWETRNSKLIPYLEHIQDMIPNFESISFKYIPREDNQFADALATLSSMFALDQGHEMPIINIRRHDKQAFYLLIDNEVDQTTWYHDIKQYLMKNEYPEGINDNDKKTIRRRVMGFLLMGDVLYKRTFDSILLRCVDQGEVQPLMKEIHEGVFGVHVPGHVMKKKIRRAGYFWSTMEKDCHQYAKKCHKCQAYADSIHVPPTPLNILASPWPFSMWGVDVIGPIEPKASNGHRFILVAIDYFTKWVEAASYAYVTKKVVSLPKMNGAVEAANKNIKKIIQKMVKSYKDWHEMLPFALHGYKTSIRTSTGATPFSLVYGIEAVLPVEVEIPSLRVIMEAKLSEAKWVQNRYDQLNLIEEKRLSAICHGQAYQKKIKEAYNKKISPHVYQEGDLVMKKLLPAQKDKIGKWALNNEGPFVVKRAFSGVALILTNMDGEELQYPINSDMVKKYYA